MAHELDINDGHASFASRTDAWHRPTAAGEGGSGDEEHDAAVELADPAHSFLTSTGGHPGAVGFVVTAPALRLFEIDTAAFDRWVADKGEELECDVPDRYQQHPARALSNLVREARCAGVITAVANDHAIP